MKGDIVNRADIELFVHEFYQKLLNDSKLQHFFSHISNDGHLESHLITIVNFWEDILFLTNNYNKNAMKPHLELHQKLPFKAEHFNKWLSHFNSAIDNHFIGEKANIAKNRALSIATIMQIKLNN